MDVPGKPVEKIPDTLTSDNHVTEISQRYGEIFDNNMNSF